MTVSAVSRRPSILPQVLLVGCVAIVFAWFIRRSTGPVDAGLEVGAALPPIQAAGWLNGEPDFEGKVVLVEAWASWCGPCRQQAPELVQLHKIYKDRPVEFISLTAEEASELPAIKEFVEATGMTWPNGYGASKTLKILGADAIPRTWIVSPEGKIVWNLSSPGTLEEALADAVAALEAKS